MECSCILLSVIDKLLAVPEWIATFMYLDEVTTLTPSVTIPVHSRQDCASVLMMPATCEQNGNQVDAFQWCRVSHAIRVSAGADTKVEVGTALTCHYSQMPRIFQGKMARR